MSVTLRGIQKILKRYAAMERAELRRIEDSKKAKRMKGGAGKAARSRSQRRMSIAKQDEINRFLEDKLGGQPRGGMDWASLAERYPEKFEDFVREYEEQEEFESEEE